MPERRPLVEGLKPIPTEAEKQFVYGGKPETVAPTPIPTMAPTANFVPRTTPRIPLTSRVRADIAEALKRASLERQLQQIEPSSVQDILESALEPWLKANGYLP